MAAISTMMPLGTKAPDFTLVDTVSGTSVQLHGHAAVATVVVFICNHCPSVVHLVEQFTSFAAEVRKKGVRVLAISSNDPASYPEDDPIEMQRFANEHRFDFPYLFDDTQDVAREYNAACTPDFFVFDADLLCVYRGRFDDSTPGNGKPVTGYDLQDAVESVLNGQPVSDEQWPSIGCSIKWKRSV